MLAMGVLLGIEDHSAIATSSDRTCPDRNCTDRTSSEVAQPNDSNEPREPSDGSVDGGIVCPQGGVGCGHVLAPTGIRVAVAVAIELPVIEDDDTLGTMCSTGSGSCPIGQMGTCPIGQMGACSMGPVGACSMGPVGASPVCAASAVNAGALEHRHSACSDGGFVQAHLQTYKQHYMLGMQCVHASTTWLQLDEFVTRRWQAYLRVLDPSSSLGVSTLSLHSYTLGAVLRTFSPNSSM